MGSTNKTDNLELSQFTDADRPSWRGDVNDSFAKIDHYAGETNESLIAMNGEIASAIAKSDEALLKSVNAVQDKDFTASNILNMVKQGDGPGSGLDADMLGGVASNRYVLKDDLINNGGLFNGLKEMVVVGSSNAVPGTWGQKVASKFGLNENNFAIGGGAFSTNSFMQQLQNAATSTTFDNNKVGLVIIGDASNDVRGMNSVNPSAYNTIQYAKTAFPNARVVALPVIWPDEARERLTGLPGYNVEWPNQLRLVVNDIRAACVALGAEMIEDSWTWLTGRTGVMVANEVHPNDSGHTIIANYVAQYFKEYGSGMRYDVPWQRITPIDSSFAIDAMYRPLSVRRDGWNVIIDGAVKATSAGNGAYSDIGRVPRGFTPNYATVIGATQGNETPKQVTVYPDGTLRIWGTVSNGAQIALSSSYLYG